MKILDLTGQTFAGLTVVAMADRSKSGAVRWSCRCECGATTTTASYDLKSGNTTSCGCRRGKNAKHGHARVGAVTPEYRAWKSMIARCTDPKNARFARYGARGVTVCERWRTFENFLADMGQRPDGVTGRRATWSIDRRENTGNYEPGNCRWATRVVQARNSTAATNVTVRGETLCVAAWAERLGVDRFALADRASRSSYEAVVDHVLRTGALPRQRAPRKGRAA